LATQAGAWLRKFCRDAGVSDTEPDNMSRF
jgi:hypothetical protein